MEQPVTPLPDLGEQADAIYENELRPIVETEANIGKILVLDPESGDYEIDAMGIETSLRLQARHPGARLYAYRIGYKAIATFGGDLERADPR